MDVEGELAVGCWELDVGTEMDREKGGLLFGGGGEGLDLRSKLISSLAVGRRRGA